MDVHAKRQEQQARYESLAQTRSHDADGSSNTRLEAMRLIHSKIMDYKHEHPANLRKTIELLLKLCQNICDAPDDPKFRRVANSPPACSLQSCKPVSVPLCANFSALLYTLRISATSIGVLICADPCKKFGLCRFHSVKYRCIEADVPLGLACRH